MKMIRDERYEWEKEYLAPWAYLSEYAEDRLHSEGDDEYRTRFRRDRDRILTCSYFRQLADKTQVYTYSHSDLFRRRLTHTLEVHRLSLTLCDFLGTNEHLVSAIAYAHDLGHVPFGHEGERVLRQHTSLANFSHAAQGLRVVDFLIDKYYESKGFFGLNLTNEVRESMLKHSGIEQTILDKYANSHIHPRVAPPVEGQIVQTADLIAALISDLDDAISTGLLEVSEIAQHEVVKEHIKKYPKGGNEKKDPVISDLHSLIDKLTWSLMQDAIVTTREILTTGFLGGHEFYEGKKVKHSKNLVKEYIRDNPRKLIPDIENVYILKEWGFYPSVVRLSALGQAVARVIWKIREKSIWNSSLVSRMNHKASLVVCELIKLFRGQPQLMYHCHMPYAEEYLQKKYKLEDIDFYKVRSINFYTARSKKTKAALDRIIVDYIASLSDMTAIDEYQRLTDPSRRPV